MDANLQYEPHQRVLYLSIGKQSDRPAWSPTVMTLQCDRFELQTVLEHLDPSLDAILVNADDQSMDTALWQLRSAEPSWSLPIFVAKPPTALAACLADGITADINEACTKAETIRRRLALLPAAAMTYPSAEYKLLAFLFSREGLKLSPTLQTDQAKLWVYPLPEALAANSKQQPDITQLELDGLLTPVGLLDRLRVCKHCESAALSFIDTCANCDSIDIEQARFFHCFTCGHVAPESNFARREGLICPQCQTHFRHIGVDYDRPLEQYICNSCSATFVEGNTVARCLSCKKNSAPEELRDHRVQHYAITAHAEAALQQGRLRSPEPLATTGQFAAPAYFHQMLDWLLNLVQRYDSEAFCLLSIAVVQPPGQNDAVPREHNDAFFKRVAELIRDTDLIHRVSQDSVWILLPKTPAGSLKAFVDQVRKLAIQLRHFKDQDLYFSSLCIPEDIPPTHSADTVLQFLQQG